MNKISEKKALWVDELPRDIKVLIENAKIDALIENFKKTNDPCCLSFCVITLLQKIMRKRHYKQSRILQLERSHKKGLVNMNQKIQEFYIWELLKGRDTNANVIGTSSLTECGISEDAIRKNHNRNKMIIVWKNEFRFPYL